jgi:hypothetical protein
MMKRIVVFIPSVSVAAVVHLVLSKIPHGFDSTAWKAQSGNYEAENPRSDMVESLEKNLQAGMCKQTILDLLGPPDTTRKAREADT